MKLHVGFLACLLGAAPALAQTPAKHTAAPPASATAPQQPAAPSAPPPAAASTKIDPVKAADIRRLLEIAGGKDMAQKSMDNMMSLFQNSLSKSLPPGDASQKLIQLFLERLKTKLNVEALQDQIVSIYDKYLTDDDIQGLIRFYQTPLGQRTLKVLPQILQESREAGFRLGEKAGREAMQEVLEEHPELRPTQPSSPDNPQP